MVKIFRTSDRQELPKHSHQLIFNASRNKDNVVQDDLFIGKTTFRDVNTVLAQARDIETTFYYYPWLHASLSLIARVIAGSGFDITLSDINSSISKQEQEKLAKPILNALNNKFVKEKWNNIKDFVSNSEKIKMTILYLMMYNQAGWEVIRDGRGGVVGFDFIHGLIVPNTNKDGTFKEVAWYVFPLNADKPSDYIEYKNSSDIVFFTKPGIDGKFYGKSDIKSILELTIPADIHAAKSYLKMHQNTNRPAGIWILEDMEDDEFDEMGQMIRSHYKGSDNYGSTAIVTNRKVDFKEFRSAAKDDAPYLEGRTFAKGENAAVTGVPTSKLGVSEDVDKSDLQQMRREFYESTMRPLMTLIEETINTQIIERYFSTIEIKFQFKQPDFATAIERSSVASRYYQSGVMNPNEIRGTFLNLPPRKGGDKYYEEVMQAMKPPIAGGKTMTTPPNGKGIDGEQGGAPRKRTQGETQERKPGDVGRSTQEAAPAVKNRQIILRGEFDKVIRELALWEQFNKDIIFNKRQFREFNFKEVPESLAYAIAHEMDVMVWQYPSQDKQIMGFSRLISILYDIVYSFYDVVESIEKE